MSITIGPNIASLMTQRQLTKATDSISTSFERLASGMRINRASDDAAGLAIATSLSVESRVFNQGVKNINEAISMLSIAEGASNELSSMTHRLMELAEQSANGVYTSTQRSALDLEAQSLKTEFDRIVASTKYNGVTLLDGSAGDLVIQGGGNLRQLLVDIPSMASSLTGTGEFTNLGTIDLGSGEWRALAYDFNGDGKMDLVASGQGMTHQAVLLGNGDGTFKAKITIAAGITITTQQAVADVNGDGYADIIGGGIGGTNPFVVTLSNGDGTFKASKTFVGNNSGLQSSNSLNIGDFNGDGKLDLVQISPSDAAFNIVLGNGDGTFKAFTSFASNGTGTSLSGDFDNDGKLDILAIGGQLVEFHRGNGDGTFQIGATYKTGLATTDRSTMTDFNGDGIMDLAVASSIQATFSIMLGNADGSFKARATYLTTGNTSRIEYADINGDGAADIITTGSNTDTVEVFFGNGNGTFKAGITSLAGDNPLGLTVADFNGDGVNDVATANNGTPNEIVIGLGEYTTSATLPSFNLRSQSGALAALSIFNSASEILNTSRGKLGGYRARLELQVNVLGTLNVNYRQAISTIQDADMATESANLVRNQIIQKTAAAVLSQANVLPRIALMLLDSSL